MARGALRNAQIGQPVATRSARGRMGCYVLVADPRWPRGRRARRVCNSACGLPAAHPSARCSMAGVNPALMSRGQSFLPAPGLMLPGY
jgi:hypothetical protein